ncbi:hypothetical protein W97_05674 [Coniosporium apollinis CBS 100218]|uniref:Epoxide hydrolase N-terminal domain-containing protein n=1 Tax=Coniosporium apollinis (strain CBS 100218) TaxID=1168221 RepID=R7YX90_CONA1|nr:uncharacterized protein W97_05674 [Coniosporium apollinis CBS 100218]EON66281.1 hypothetical protein W97_05674 [Coniosporium apollinis CBS 100218]
MASKCIFPTISEDIPLNTPVRYYPRVDDEFLKVTKTKLSLTRYPEEQDGVAEDDWSQGAKVKEVRRLARFWQDKHDWKAQEDRIQQMSEHFLVRLDVPGYGILDLHFLHQRSKSSNAIPLLFCHGWPGSFLEARHVLTPLTTPSPQHQDLAFHVIVPSIPGFGFSPAPRRPGLGPTILARAYKQLMTSVLGYTSGFATQGGDFGAFVSRSIALQYPDLVLAQHLNMFPVPAPTLLRAPKAYLRWCLSCFLYSDFEKSSLEVRTNFEHDQSGYLDAQKTRPQTLGFALGDSPVGLLAWFVEKFHDWVDVKGNRALEDAEIIDLVMMHWIQGATPGLRFYREAFWGGRRDAEETFERWVGVPTGVSMYAREQLHCPRDWAAQVANIVFWREHGAGGHFSSLERPEQFVEDMRAFFECPAVQKSVDSHLGCATAKM